MNGGALSRRRLVGGLATCTLGTANVGPATTPAPAAADATHPDAVLLAVVAEYAALRHEYLGLFRSVADENERERRIAPLDAAQDALLPRLIKARATTPDGFRARAELLVLCAPDRIWDLERPDCCQDEMMLGALLRDMAGTMLRYRLRARDHGRLPALVA